MHNFKPTGSSSQSEDTIHTLEVTHVPECFAEKGSILSVTWQYQQLETLYQAVGREGNKMRI